MKRIDSIDQLKLEAAYDDGKNTAEFFILLKGSARSSKRISYFPDTNLFDVFNEIDDSWQEELTEDKLRGETNIVLAMERGAFFKYE